MEFLVILPAFLSPFFALFAKRYDLFDVWLSSLEEDSEASSAICADYPTLWLLCKYYETKMPLDSAR